MKRQQGQRFMKVFESNPNSDNGIDDDFGMDEIQAHQPPFKKTVTPADFLYKFTNDDITKIETYLQKNKHLLKVAPPTKISLFEDIYMLMQFIRNREFIRQNQRKGLEAICRDLQRLIRRSNVTIRERLTRKFVHMRVQEIMLAIQQNRHLVFDKHDKSKKTNLTSEHSGLGVSPVKIEGHVDRQRQVYKMQFNEDNHYDQDTRSGGQGEKSYRARKNEQHLIREEQPSNGGIYKYGSNPIRQRIFIYANKTTKRYKPVLQSKLHQFQEQIRQIQHQSPPPPPPPPPPKTQPQPLSSFKLEFDSPPKAQPLPSLKSEFDNLPKAQLLPSLQFELDSQMQQPVRAREEDSDDISSDTTFRELTQQIKEKLIGPMDPQPPQRHFLDDQIIQELQDELMCKVSLNKQTLLILKTHPQKKTMYVWEQQQDLALFNFHFHPQAHSDELRCMLRYKSFNIIMERIKYLNIAIKQEAVKVLNDLERQVSLANMKEFQIVSQLKSFGKS